MRIRNNCTKKVTNRSWFFKSHDSCGTVGVGWVDRSGIVDDIAILFMVWGEKVALHNEMGDVVCFTRKEILAAYCKGGKIKQDYLTGSSEPSCFSICNWTMGGGLIGRLSFSPNPQHLARVGFCTTTWNVFRYENS